MKKIKLQCKQVRVVLTCTIMAVISVTNFSAVLAAFDAPQTIGYDGYIIDSSGNPQTRIQTVRVRIYDASSAGYFSLAVGSGVYNGGSVSALAGLPFNRQYFLALEITTLSTGEMLPRIPLNALAYAYAAYGLVARAADPSNNLTSGEVYFNTTTKTLKVYNGTVWVALGPSGLTSLNGQTGDSQTFTTTTAA